jgi:hypothetical protein
MIILDVPQLSTEWFRAKAGLPSAGSFDMIVQANGEPSKQRQKYLYQLAGETISGIKPETYMSFAMKQGVETEGDARKTFEFINEVEVKQAGIVYPDEEKRYSCSPDGLLEDSGLEIKCPLIHTHVGYLLSGGLPVEYKQQVMGGMLVTGFDSWYFMSYFKGLPPLIILVERDEKFIAKLKEQLEGFCGELSKTVERLRVL